MGYLVECTLHSLGDLIFEIGVHVFKNLIPKQQLHL